MTGRKGDLAVRRWETGDEDMKQLLKLQNLAVIMVSYRS